jgi:hypothetical protein
MKLHRCNVWIKEGQRWSPYTDGSELEGICRIEEYERCWPPMEPGMVENDGATGCWENNTARENLVPARGKNQLFMRRARIWPRRRAQGRNQVGSCPSLGAPLGLASGSWGWGLEFEIDICLFCKNYGWEAELYFKNIKWVKFY